MGACRATAERGSVVMGACRATAEGRSVVTGVRRKGARRGSGAMWTPALSRRGGRRLTRAGWYLFRGSPRRHTADRAAERCARYGFFLPKRLNSWVSTAFIASTVTGFLSLSTSDDSGVGAAAADVGRAAVGGGDDPPHADGAEQAAIGLQGNAARQGLGDPVRGVIGQIASLCRGRSGEGGEGQQRDQERTHDELIHTGWGRMAAFFLPFMDRDGAARLRPGGVSRS